jgi:hypothetical protein
METEYLAFNDSCQRKVIEELSESLPNIGVSILSQTFIIETVPIITD